jgi:hypothetical protein
MERPTQTSRQSATWEALAAIRSRAHAKTQALTAARKRKDGLTREQLRVVLEDEMARRGIANDPLWVESRVDILDASHLGRVRQAWRAVRSVASTLRNPIPPPAGRPRARPISLPPEPQRPHDQSLYHVGPLSEEWAVVELDPAMHGVLDQVHAQPPDKVGEIAAIDVFLAWDDGSPLAQSGVAVQIGPERCQVGMLSGDAAEHFHPALLAASTRGQVAAMTGYLRPADGRQPPYLLTLRLPERRTEP